MNGIERPLREESHMSENIHTSTPPADNTGVQPNDILEPQDAMTAPPPVPQRKPGFFRRLFMSRKKQQAVAVQNGYLEMVDLIRAISRHLDRQETVQTRVLSMLEKVPDTMERQHEVMSLFKQQLENNMENDRQLTDSMERLSGTLDAMNDSQKASSRTITDLIGRSRETEQLLREVMRRAERRMTFLIAFFILLVIGVGVYLIHWQNLPAASRLQSDPVAATVALETRVESPVSATAELDVVAAPAVTDSLPESLPPVETAPAATSPETAEKSGDSTPPLKPQVAKPKTRASPPSKAQSKSKSATPKKASAPKRVPAPAAKPAAESTPEFEPAPTVPLAPESADFTLAPLQEVLNDTADQPAAETPVSLP